MANAYKILGAAAPATTANSTLYTVPSVTEAVVSSLVVCNQSTASQTFRCAVTTGGAPSASNYLYYDLAVPSKDTFTASIAITLDASDKVFVQSGSTGTVLSYNLFGAEIT